MRGALQEKSNRPITDRRPVPPMPRSYKMGAFDLQKSHRLGSLVITLMVLLHATCCVALGFTRHHTRSGSLLTTHGKNQQSVLLHSSNKKEDSNDGNLFRRYLTNPLDMSSNSKTANKSKSSYESQYQQYQQRNGQTINQSYITREMEQEVMAAAKANVDSKTVSRAISSLINDDTAKRKEPKNNNNQIYGTSSNKEKNTLRNLAGNIQPSESTPNQQPENSTQEHNNNNSWDTQQIALASGATTFLFSPIIIPIIHSLIPPILPFPSSISIEGAALLGTLAYILALGDPTNQSMGDGVEVTGAVSRIVGRTALQSVQTSAPRLKAVARAVVDYDSTVNTMEEMKQMQYQLSQRLLELESENESLRREVALWNAVEDLSGVYKLEELKEMARVEGVRGYSTDGKSALLRRLVNEGVLKLDLSPYFRVLVDDV